MQAHNRRSARLGLESLEGRVVLSTTTLPAPTALVGQPSDASTIPVKYQSFTAQTASIQPASVTTVTRASFAIGWAVGPRAILLGTNSTTANGKSSGSVAMALVRSQTGAIQIGGP